MALWKSVVGKLWMTIIGLVAVVISTLGIFLLIYLDENANTINSYDVKILFVATGTMGFLLTTFFAFFLLTKITQPLRKMKEAADQIIVGEYSTRVPTRSTDEIGELAKTFNHMAEELEATILDLNHEKEHLSSVVRSMADAVITFNAEGQAILTNPQGEMILQRWNEFHWEGADDDSAKSHSQLPQPLRGLFESVLRESTDLSTKVHVLNEVWSVVMTPLHANDAVRGSVAVLRNVTEEFRLERLRKDFVANVSHEIRTPLSMLQGYSEALLDDIAASPEERKELVQVIYDESLRMGRLVNDLLDLARMEAGHMEMHFSEVDVDILIQRVFRKFLVLSKERNVQLIYDKPDRKLLLQAADEDRLEQVLTNLLDNAFRHTAEGASVTISAEEVESRGERMALIGVADQGRGIPAEDLPYIFERFYKADKARTRGHNGGTGLGLAIVKNIVDAHHGIIKAESEIGQGTTFSIMIPIDEH